MRLTNRTTDHRRGVILIVVLIMLTLFAVVGVTFVFFSEQELQSAQFFSDAQTVNRPTDDLLFAFILNQLIYGTEDTESALIGQSLLENMYGQYGQAAEINQGEIPRQLLLPTGQPVPYAGPGMPPNPLLIDVDGDLRIGLFDLNFRDPLTGVYINQTPGAAPFTSAKIRDNNGNGYIDYEDLQYRHPSLAPPPPEVGWADVAIVAPNPIPGDTDNNGVANDFVDLRRLTAFSGSGKRIFNDPTVPAPLNPANGHLYINFRRRVISGPAVGLPPGVVKSAVLHAERGAFNPSYSYPDHNFPLLGAINSNGTVIARTFVRADETGNDPFLDSSPATWLAPTLTAAGFGPGAAHFPKLIRPRPGDQAVGASGFLFPMPEDPGGDVKNVQGARGVVVSNLPNGAPIFARNDSYWFDPNFPIQTGPDGKRYKPLFAIFVMDMDGKLNVNDHFNSFGRLPNGLPASVSNQGHGPWEVGLPQQRDLPQPRSIPPANQVQEFQQFALEYYQLLHGRAAANLPANVGRYGDIPANSFPGRPALPPLFPQAEAIPGSQLLPGGFFTPGSLVLRGGFYAPVDYNGYDETTPLNPRTNPPVLPGVFTPALTTPNYVAFALHPQGYENTGTVVLSPPLPLDPLRLSHPLLYKYFGPAPHDRRIRTSAVDGLLRMNDTNADANSSEILRLLPNTFGSLQSGGPNNRLRWMLTTDSVDRGSAGHRPISATLPNLPSPDFDLLYPRHSLLLRAIGKDPYFGPPLAPTGTFNRYFDFSLGDFYPPDADPPAPTPDMPTPLAGTPIHPPFVPRFPGQRFDLLNLSGPGMMFQYPLPTLGTAEEINIGLGTADRARFVRAQIDRQRLAKQIYALLVESTGTFDLLARNAAPPPVAVPPPVQDTLRRLAQLAVNIVDYIDEDHYSTPFNWGAVGSDQVRASLGNQFVFGTELPRLLLNEAYVEGTANDPNNPQNHQVRVWLELHNPLFTDPRLRESGATRIRPTNGPNLIHPYQIEIGDYIDPAQTNTTGNVAMVTAGQPYAIVNDFAPDQNIVTAGGQTDVVGPSDGNFDGGIRQQDPNDADYEFYPQALNRGWCLIGPRAAGAAVPPTGQDLPKGMAPNPKLPKNTHFPADPGMGTPPNLAFTVNRASIGQLAIALRRLACPHIPHNPLPGQAGHDPTRPINPYVTVDSMTIVNDPDFDPANPMQVDPDPNNNFDEINDTNGRMQPQQRWSVGREQPYAGHHSRMRRQLPDTLATDPMVNPLPEQPQHTFLRHNYEYWAETMTAGVNLPSGPPNLTNPPGYPMPPPAGQAPPPAPISGTPTLKMPFDWLVHLDRPLVSSMELLHVSAYGPHELTQRFMFFHDQDSDGRWDVPGENQYTAFQHLVPWFWDDATANPPPPPLGYASIQRPLFTFLEFVETRPLSQWGQPLSRRSGKINLNTIWDQAVLEALIDMPYLPPQLDDPTLPPAQRQLLQQRWELARQNLWDTIRASRDGQFGPVRPILGNPVQALPSPPFPPGTLAKGPFWSLTGMDPQSPYQQAQPQPQPIHDGYLRPNLLAPPSVPNSPLGLWGTTVPRLLELMNPLQPNQALFTHPFERAQLMAKINNNLTTRSNVFAVWVTVGYFEVHTQTLDPNPAVPFNPITNPYVDKLGAEIGRADGQQKRHRFFAVVDRSVFERYIAPAAIGFNPYARYDPRRDYTSVPDPVLGNGPPSGVLHWTIIE